MGKAMRDVYGESLAKYGAENKKVVVLDADLSSSSRTSKFGAVAPDRLFNMGIAEAGMVAAGAGFASCGFIPFVNTFATLADSMCYLCTKAMIAYSGLNVRIVGSNNGVGGAYDGSTHHTLDDLSVMKNVPEMLVMTPSDPVMAEWMIKTLIEDYTGPAYLSMERTEAENIYDDASGMEIGKNIKLRSGKDAAIFACGLSVARSLKAAKILEEEGINVAVYDCFTIKPFDTASVEDALKETKNIVTVEEHSVVGGLGSLVLEAVAQAGIAANVKKVGFDDCFTESGSYGELIEKHGLSAKAIAEAVKATMKG